MQTESSVSRVCGVTPWHGLSQHFHPYSKQQQLVAAIFNYVPRLSRLLLIVPETAPA
jgi:hypothetical protein